MSILLDGLFKKNPVLVLAMGLVPAVAITTTALNGFVLGISIAAVLLAASVITYVLEPHLPTSARLPMRVLVIIVLVVALYGLILHTRPGLVAGLGIFFPFMAADAFRLQHPEDERTFRQVVLEAVGQGLGFIWALLLIGLIREFLGFGSIFGREIVTGVLRPFSLANRVPGGLIIVGLLLALTRLLTKQGGELHD
ncbi:MAG: Rnf-Nqr domain containing protein [Bacillota bacterium]|jgi:electron transport complex protein RnfE|nr:Rnf-Nqr domain containing protein [Bacillota bacterium]